MSAKHYDLVVVGGGPGGYVAAIRAGQLGLKTALVERDQLGGICCNWGCIPTKALLRASEIKHTLDHLHDFGFSAENISFDLAKVIGRSRNVTKQLTGGIAQLLKKNKVEVIQGAAKVEDKGLLSVATDAGEQQVSADHIIIATGARPRELPHLQADGKLVWTYKEAMVPESLPEKLLVVGSGAIGIEFASFYQTMGSQVTVVEVLDRILPVEDEEISEFAAGAFKQQGMTIHTGASVENLDPGADDVTATIKLPTGEVTNQSFDRVILAIGITGNTEDLGLEALGVNIDRGHIETDQWSRTNVPGLYAIGDVAGAPWLAHKASHEGVICVEKIAGVEHVQPLRVDNVPGCTYCHPQVASVGLTEAQAREQGYNVRIGRFNMMGSGKAVAVGDTHGMVKTVFDDATGELLGAHMIGPEVTEQIQGFGIARTLESTEAELMHTVFAHPTLSEGMHESVLDAFDQVIHN